MAEDRRPTQGCPPIPPRTSSLAGSDLARRQAEINDRIAKLDDPVLKMWFRTKKDIEKK